MHGHERAALRTEKELRHQATNEVDYPPEILDAWRGEQQRLKSLLIDHDDADWAYPRLRPAAAPLPPVVTPAPSAPKGQPSRPSWSQVLAPSSASAPTVAAPPRVVEVVKEKQPLTLVGGVDLSFFRDDKRTAIAALVVCSFPQLEVVYEIYKVVELTAPYIPGYLAFREVPALVGLIDHIRRNKPQYLPQVLLVDGNGVLHYGGFGSACQLGVVSGIPTIGVAKKLLCVDGLTSEVDIDRWLARCQQLGREWVEIEGRSGQIHGAMIRPQSGRQTAAARSRGGSADPPTPLFVSLGHRVSLQTAVQVTLACIQRTMPEPIDQADLRSREHVRKLNQDCKRKGEQRPPYGLMLEKVHNGSSASSSTAASPSAKPTAARASSNTAKQRNARVGGARPK